MNQATIQMPLETFYWLLCLAIQIGMGAMALIVLPGGRHGQ